MPGSHRRRMCAASHLEPIGCTLRAFLQLLARFSPATLERYLQCMETFLEMWGSQSQLNHGTIEKASIADYLLAAQRSATQDRATHRTSPLTALTALRWFSKITEWADLELCLAAPLIASYARGTTCRDRREAFPIPMAVVAGFEKAVCDSSTPDSIALFLGCLFVHAQQPPIRGRTARGLGFSSTEPFRSEPKHHSTANHSPANGMA